MNFGFIPSGREEMNLMDVWIGRFFEEKKTWFTNESNYIFGFKIKRWITWLDRFIKWFNVWSNHANLHFTHKIRIQADKNINSLMKIYNRSKHRMHRISIWCERRNRKKVFPFFMSLIIIRWMIKVKISKSKWLDTTAQNQISMAQK